MSTRTRPIAAEVGLYKVSVKIQAYPDPVAHTVYCATLGEWKDLQDSIEFHPAKGFRGQYFCIPPGNHIILARLETLPGQ